MSLSCGSYFGRYEITGTLGVGGMGEVYRARDRKLNRDVAIKVIAGAPGAGNEHRQRFEREARVLASLSHPHIGHIYGLEEDREQVALVLELVEGESLADRIAEASRSRTRLHTEEVCAWAGQIADALDAAHQKGIVHRDLKPANIRITPTGAVKVLDFGIARQIGTATAPGGIDQNPTATAEVTGDTSGTLPYMSPEQVRGRSVDARTDVWAFGCVLFEMLSGARPFAGSTPWDTAAAILEREPDWELLPSSTPARLQALLRRCLQKDPHRRLHAIADARIELEEIAAEARPGRARFRGGPQPRRFRRLAWLVGVLGAAGGLALLGVSVYRLWDRPPALPALSNPRQVTTAIGVEDYPTPSPDGRMLAYESNQAGNWDIWVAQVDGGRAINRSADHAGDDRYPSWSPDGSQIAFWSERDGGGYFLMSAVGGAATKIVGTEGLQAQNHGPAAWSPDGTRLAYVSHAPKGGALIPSLSIVNVVTRQRRTMPLPGTQESRLDLAWSPDGRLIAYVDGAQQPAETTRLMVMRLSDGAAFDVTNDRANARSPLWSRDNRELYFSWNRIGASDLWRRRISEDGSPRGQPQQVTAGLEILHATFSAAGDKLLYAKGRWTSNVWRVPIGGSRPATWADAKQVTFEHAFIEFVDVSPDERMLAVSSDRAGNQDLWTLAFDTGEMTRLTSDPAPEWAPRWSPDGREITFYASLTGDREIYVVPAAGGPARRLTTSPGLDATPDWSPDGRWIAYRSERTGSSDIWVTSVDGRESQPIAADSAPDYAPSWSPDGRSIAFSSVRGGVVRLWRAPFPTGTPSPITGRSGYFLRWSRADRRIYFGGADKEAADFWSITPAERTPRLAVHLEGRRGSPGSQPPAVDSRYLYFTWREDPADIWIMDVRR